MSNESEIFSTQTVYKKTSTGKIQQWRAWVETTATGFLMKVESGQTDGKLTETAGQVIDEGKHHILTNYRNVKKTGKAIDSDHRDF